MGVYVLFSAQTSYSTVVLSLFLLEMIPNDHIQVQKENFVVSCLLIYVLHVSEIRHFHVVVVQGR